MDRRGMAQARMERGSSEEREWRGGDRAREEHFFFLLSSSSLDFALGSSGRR